MILNEMHTRAARIACTALVCVLTCIAATNVSAQESGVDAAAANAQQPNLTTVATKTAQELEAKKVKKVAVFDFVGPGRTITVLGVRLADDFSAALAKSGKHLRVEDRASLARSVREVNYGPEDLLDSGSILPLASALGMTDAILGEISANDGQVKLSVYVFQLSGKSATLVDKEDEQIPGSEVISKLLAAELAHSGGKVIANEDLSAAGMRGFAYPTCLHCPPPEWPRRALNHRMDATVKLSAIITADGHPDDIRVMVGLPDDFTAASIEAVRQWKFNPGTDPDGKPVAVRGAISLMFRLPPGG